MVEVNVYKYMFIELRWKREVRPVLRKDENSMNFLRNHGADNIAVNGIDLTAILEWDKCIFTERLNKIIDL